MQYLKLLFALLLITSLGCEQVDDLVGGVDAPTVSYSATTLEADFYEAGSSAAPTLAWNGDQGTISLATTLNGLSVNSTTGQLQWTKLLPPGIHNVEVVVANSEGQVIVPVTIENPLKGNFEGTYNGSYSFTLEFSQDGSLIVRADGETATGSWEINDGEMIAYYIYDNFPDIDYSLRADIEQTNAEATVTGEYYSGEYDPASTAINDFAVSLQ